MSLLGSNRTACISFDEGTVSSPFPLERGRTQGNRPSPCEFNIGQQISLFKIEFCPSIRGVYNHLFVPRPVLNNSYLRDQLPIAEAAASEEDNPLFRNEAASQSSTAEGFADDTTATVLFNYETLSSLKSSLHEFSTFSGLKCNLDKTMLMQIGSIIPVPEAIQNLGFSHVNKLKILGLEIDQDTVCCGPRPVLVGAPPPAGLALPPPIWHWG